MSLSENRTRNRRPRLGLWIPLTLVVGCMCIIVSIIMTNTLLAEEKEKTVKNSIVYGLTLSPSGIDPHINANAELGIPLYSVYDTLIYRHPQTGVFVDGLAEQWEISPDGLVYTFHLRDDVKFHDDTPFNADAVGVTLDRIFDTSDPKTASQKARFMLGPNYQGYVIVDAYTIEILLSAPYVPLLDALSQPYFGIASPTALANIERTRYQLHQVGTGPYKMVEYTPGDSLVLERNEDYTWGPVFYAKLKPEVWLERVTFRFFTDPATRRTALEAGDVQIIGELPPIDAQLLLTQGDTQVYTQAIPGQPLQFYFNTQKAPTDDLNMRKALITVTNREAIVESVFRTDFSPVAFGPMSANMPYYNPEVQSLYLYDPQQARTFFTAAGYTDSDDDGFLDKAGEPLALKMIVPPWGFSPDVATLIQSQWREIGIELTIESVPSYTVLLEKAKEGDYNLIAYYDFGTDPSLLDKYYTSNSPSNWTYYSDTELDGWLQQGGQTSDEVARNEFYRLIQNRIMEQALILPIRDYVNLVGWTKNLDGLIFSPQGWWTLLNNLQFNQS